MIGVGADVRFHDDGLQCLARDDLIAKRRIVQAKVDLIVQRLLLDVGQQVDQVRRLIAVVRNSGAAQRQNDAIDVAGQAAGHVVIVVQARCRAA